MGGVGRETHRVDTTVRPQHEAEENHLSQRNYVDKPGCKLRKRLQLDLDVLLTRKRCWCPEVGAEVVRTDADERVHAEPFAAVGRGKGRLLIAPL